MQKPYFKITLETKLTDEDFVIIQAYLRGCKNYYAINTKEIIGFDFQNACIFFKNGDYLSLYEDYKISKKENIKLDIEDQKTKYRFSKSSFDSKYFRQGIIDRLKNNYGCTQYGETIILPKTNKVLSKYYEFHLLGFFYRLCNPHTAFSPIVQEIKDILQAEIDKENEQIDIDNKEIDRQNQEWKTNKIKAQNIMERLMKSITNN
jgi:hypothetical protein